MKGRLIGLIVAVSAVMMFAVPAMALDLVVGQDFYINNMYDQRTYHESHPRSSLLGHPGGWIQGITIHNDDVKNSIGEVRLTVNNTLDGGKYVFSQTVPDTYPWGDKDFADYAMWNGHMVMVDQDGLDIQAFDTDSSSINFKHWDGTLLGQTLTLTALFDVAPAPICKIKHMAIKKNGDLKMRFTAPYDIRQEGDHSVQIRVRIFNEEGTGLDTELPRIYPPFQIEKKDGTIVPDKVKVDNIPAEFAGRTGRLEYRVFYPGDTPMTECMLRGVTYFKLPELEE